METGCFTHVDIFGSTRMSICKLALREDKLSNAILAFLCEQPIWLRYSATHRPAIYHSVWAVLCWLEKTPCLWKSYKAKSFLCGPGVGVSLWSRVRLDNVTVIPVQLNDAVRARTSSINSYSFSPVSLVMNERPGPSGTLGEKGSIKTLTRLKSRSNSGTHSVVWLFRV